MDFYADLILIDESLDLSDVFRVASEGSETVRMKADLGGHSSASRKTALQAQRDMQRARKAWLDAATMQKKQMNKLEGLGRSEAVKKCKLILTKAELKYVKCRQAFDVAVIAHLNERKAEGIVRLAAVIRQGAELQATPGASASSSTGEAGFESSQPDHLATSQAEPASQYTEEAVAACNLLEEDFQAFADSYVQ